MASVEKRKSGSYRVIFYHPTTGIKHQIKVDYAGHDKETLRLARAKKSEIEHKIALHRAGIEEFSLSDFKINSITELTLCEFYDIVVNDESRKFEVDNKTHYAQELALRNLMEIVGEKITLRELSANVRYINQFKSARFKIGVEKYKNKGWDFEEDKIKRGININLKDLSAIFNYAVKTGHIPEHFIPKLDKYKTVKKKDYSTLFNEEIIRVLNALDESKGESDKTIAKGDIWLAYIIVAETGLRRSAVFKRTIDDNERGLKWKDVDWMRNVIRYRSKGSIHAVPMSDFLRKCLSKRKSELGEYFDPEKHIIRYTRDTISHYFKNAMKKAGIDKQGAVHVLRHSLPLQLLEAGASAFEVQEWMNHSDMQTTNIYVHMRNEGLQKLAKRKSRLG